MGCADVSTTRPFVGPRDVAQAKEQFEYHQEELETTTERLSGTRPPDTIIASVGQRLNTQSRTGLLEKTTTQILEVKILAAPAASRLFGPTVFVSTHLPFPL